MDNNQQQKWNIGQKTILLGTSISLLLVIAKGIAGITGHSYALIADALESLSDVVGSLVVWMVVKYASRPPDSEHPYGHGRAETLVIFVVVAILMSTAGYISYQSIHNIRTPHQMPSDFTLIVLLIVIAFKEMMYRITIRRSKKTGSSALRAEAIHHRSDAITSIVAFIGISIAIFMGPGYEAADDWAALVTAIVILYNCYLIFKPAWGEMMDEQTHQDLVEMVKKLSLTVEGVEGTEKSYIRKAGMNYLVDLHIEVDGNISVFHGHEIAHKVEHLLKTSGLGITYVSVHVEPRA